ncbi:MAG TPA: SMP-30/gluconolactonase/LRE family protein [Gammaproteobacteria bacterium]
MLRSPIASAKPGISRREFLYTVGAAAVAGSTGCAPPPPEELPLPPRPSYGGLDSGAFLNELTIIRELPGDDVFCEGPAEAPDGRIYFTEMRNNGGRIFRWDPTRATLETFRENTNAANGLAFDAQGRLLACEGAANQLTRMNIETGELEVLANEYGGVPIDPPNDLCLDSEGRIYFSSRPATGAPSRGNVPAVYRLDPDGTLVQLLAAPRVHLPNGVAISPDGGTFFLIETDRGEGRHRDIRAFDLGSDGSLSNERVIVNFYPGRSGDGMAIDAEGNLYVAAGIHELREGSETLDTRPGIHVFSPEGRLLAYRRTPADTITNCCFGGRGGQTLYVTAGRHFLAARTRIPGA